LGALSGWDREAWPVPSFVFEDPILEGVWWRRFYDQDDPGVLWIHQDRIRPGEPHDGWPDGIQGIKTFPARLSRLIPKAQAD
jgi:hypothetical protein